METSEIHNSARIPRRRHEKGFALIGLIYLSSIFFSVLIFFSVFTNFLKNDLKERKICITQTWKFQENQIKNIQNLFNMNKEALALRKKMQQAQARLARAAASLNPYAIAAAEAYLLYVQIQKAQLASRQQMILAKSKIELLALQGQLQSNLKARQNKAPPEGLAVEQDIPSEIASPYKTVVNFSNMQTVQTVWTRPFISLLHPVIQKISRSLHLNLNPKVTSQCSVTIERRSDRWFVALTADKY